MLATGREHPARGEAAHLPYDEMPGVSAGALTRCANLGFSLCLHEPDCRVMAMPEVACRPLPAPEHPVLLGWLLARQRTWQLTSGYSARIAPVRQFRTLSTRAPSQ